MAQYQSFAEVYDLFMEEIPYDEWCKNLTALLKKYNVESGLVAELGCGTGNMTELLAEAGYDMTGIDSSEDMLSEALQKRDRSGLPILYLCQDMREFELYGTMAAIVSVCDTMNYLTDPADFVKTLKLVNNYLDPHGVFVFDLKTKHYFEDVLGDGVRVVNEEEASYIWENEFDPENNINSYYLTIFKREKSAKGKKLFRRTLECHEQRAYSTEEIRKMANDAGMKVEEIKEAGTKASPNENSERIYVVLRENGK